MKTVIETCYTSYIILDITKGCIDEGKISEVTEEWDRFVDLLVENSEGIEIDEKYTPYTFDKGFMSNCKEDLEVFMKKLERFLINHKYFY